MQFFGQPTRVVIPYDAALERAISESRLLRGGVPRRILETQRPS